MGEGENRLLDLVLVKNARFGETLIRARGKVDSVNIFDANHSRCFLELTIIDNDARQVLIDYQPKNIEDAVSKLAYLSAYLISARTTLAQSEIATVLKKVSIKPDCMGSTPGGLLLFVVFRNPCAG